MVRSVRKLQELSKERIVISEIHLYCVCLFVYMYISFNNIFHCKFIKYKVDSMKIYIYIDFIFIYTMFYTLGIHIHLI